MVKEDNRVMKCELCLCEITDAEIQNNLVFDFVHPCGKHGWYHVVCAMEIIDKGVKC